MPCLNTTLLVDGFADDGARDIDVHGLHQGFLRGLRQCGGELRCSAEVRALAHAAGVWTVDLADGSQVRARCVVNAAGAWADALGALAGAAPIGLVPKRRSAFTFAVPEGMDAARWPAVISADEGFYFKPDAGQLLGSPANADPVAPQDVVPEELDVATGIWRIEEVTTLQIRRPSHTWAGLRSFVADGEMAVGWDASPAPLPGFLGGRPGRLRHTERLRLQPAGAQPAARRAAGCAPGRAGRAARTAVARALPAPLTLRAASAARSAPRSRPHAPGAPRA